MKTLQELVEFIRAQARTHGTSLTKMEEEFSWSNGTIGKWAHGKRYPSHDKLQKIADYFGISVACLTGDINKKESAPISEDELKEDAILFDAYKSAPANVQEAIRKLLGLK